MPIRPKKFRYLRRSPFPMLARITQYELDDIDRFVDLAREARKSREKRLDRLAAQIAPNDDWLVDDFAQLDDFAVLSAEFAIIGLWRCVELYRKKAIQTGKAMLGQAAAAKVRELSRSQQIRCAKTVNELRCLNDAIKHARRVDGELAKLPRWRGKKELGHVEGHYARLRSAAERYVNDLADRLKQRTTP